jgi:hypothetical protein
MIELISSLPIHLQAVALFSISVVVYFIIKN